MRNRESSPILDRLPGHFRSRDAEQGRPLEALMGLFTGELQIIEQDIDQLYDNWFVETCEPWALPYIAALVGARPMRDIGEDQAGLLRAYVANVLQYRQAKGTAAAIEQVARDVTGWPVFAVEFFQRLATSQNVNHLRPAAPAFAGIRDASAARRARGPFSTACHAAAAGPPDGWSGRYNIPHLGLFIWRQAASPLWPVISEDAGYLGGPLAVPTAAGPGLLRFDPLGRDLPLVNRPAADITIAARMSERTVPAPLHRDVLFAALNTLRDTGADPAGWFGSTPALRVRLDGAEVAPAQLFCCNLEQAADGAWRRPALAGEVLFDPELGRISLHATDEGKAVETGFAHAAPFEIGGGPYLRLASVADWQPDFVVPGEDPPWQIGVSHRAQDVTDDTDQGGPVVATLQAAINRWNADATEGSRGIIVIFDNATYPQNLTGAKRLRLPKGSSLAVVSAAWPATALPGGVIRRTPGQLSAMHRRAHIKTNITVEAEPAGEGATARLVLDGLCIEGNLRLANAGDLGVLEVHNCTIGLNQGELTGTLTAPAGNERLSVTLNRSIVARVALPEATGMLTIRRSILGEDRVAGDGTGATGRVADVPAMDVEITGSTLFGRSRMRSIEAENSIFTGRIEARRKQQGCVRFCYLPLNSSVPRRYRCVPEAPSDQMPRPVFTTTRYAAPGFGQLNLCTPARILEGAEDGMEMGVGYANRDPARRANLIDAVNEFSPFGLTPGLHFVS